MILAMQAHARMVEVSPWVRILRFDLGKSGHAACVFEGIDGELHQYDYNGTFQIGKMKKRRPKDFRRELKACYIPKVSKVRIIKAPKKETA